MFKEELCIDIGGVANFKVALSLLESARDYTRLRV